MLKETSRDEKLEAKLTKEHGFLYSKKIKQGRYSGDKPPILGRESDHKVLRGQEGSWVDSFVIRSVQQRTRHLHVLETFGTSVPPALPNDHENTSKASIVFTLCPHLSEMRLGVGVQLALVLVDSAKDRNRLAILRKITTNF